MQSTGEVEPAHPPRGRARPRLPRLLQPARLLVSLRSSDHGLLVLAVAVGAGAGGGAIGFRWLIATFTRLLSGYADYSIAGHAAHPGLPGLGRWFVIGVPVVAGAVYGPLVYFFAREARGHGVPEVMFAVARRGGRIPPQVAAVKALASALCIGGGGSVGREGPIVQIGSALGSTLGRLVRTDESHLRMLVACGAAGGIAATFNAPLAGVFFAMELILRDFTARSFGMVVLSSVTASVIGRAAFGNAAFLHLPGFQLDHPAQYLMFALLGVLAGALGVLFTRVLYAVEDGCDAAWRGPEWLRPAVGGVLLGLLLLALPEMYGVGYPVLTRAVSGGYALGFLVVLMFGKMAATSLTIGIGGSGGVFAPSLFVGGAFGAAFGDLTQHLGHGLSGPVGVYGLLGMGAVFAGAARAPITAVVIMFELTGDYGIILPLMTAVVLATGVSALLSHDTIYTLKLRRRGVDLDDPPAPATLTSVTAGQAMRPVGTTVPHDTALAELAGLVEAAQLGVVAVLGADGRYLGAVTTRGLADILADGCRQDTSAAAAVEQLPTLRADRCLADALDALDASDAVTLAVTDHDGHDQRQVLGWLTHADVLRALRGAVPAASSG